MPVTVKAGEVTDVGEIKIDPARRQMNVNSGVALPDRPIAPVSGPFDPAVRDCVGADGEGAPGAVAADCRRGRAVFYVGVQLQHREA